MNCTQKDCEEKIKIFGIGGFYHGPHHYRFSRAICPKHGEIPIWSWNWKKNEDEKNKKFWI